MNIHERVKEYHEALRKWQVERDDEGADLVNRLGDGLRAEMPALAEHVMSMADALGPFAALAEGRDAWQDDDHCGTFPTVASVRAARAALMGSLEPTPEVARLRAAVGTADRLLVAVGTVLSSPLATIGPALERMAKIAKQFNEASVATLPRRHPADDRATHIYIQRNGYVTWNRGGGLAGPSHAATMVIRVGQRVTVAKDRTNIAPIASPADHAVEREASQYHGTKSGDWERS